MVALKLAISDPVQFMGVGGEWMKLQGLDTLFPLSELSVMGVAEIIPHLPRLLRRISYPAEAV